MVRGKQELILDLKNLKDREKLLKEIIPEIDIILESYRPGVMEKLGLSPSAVHKIKPSIIYVRLSGYGNKVSPYS
jgi:crotonobetainyl-CoA:carnitine CoA-transferase CaiB-like acyl-CoA transferase